MVYCGSSLTSCMLTSDKTSRITNHLTTSPAFLTTRPPLPSRLLSKNSTSQYMPTLRALTNPGSKWLPQRGVGHARCSGRKKQCLERISGLAAFCFTMRFLHRGPCGRHSVLNKSEKRAYSMCDAKLHLQRASIPCSFH